MIKLVFKVRLNIICYTIIALKSSHSNLMLLDFINYKIKAAQFKIKQTIYTQCKHKHHARQAWLSCF